MLWALLPYTAIAETSSANEPWYCQLGALSVALDTTRQDDVRKAALDYAESLLASDPSGWFTLKEYLLRLAASDPDFLMRHYPERRRLFERWLQSLNLSWLADRPSPYPALREQALARLSDWIRTHPDLHTPASDFALRLYQRLQQTQPSVVD